MQNDNSTFTSQLKEIYNTQDKIAPLIEGLDEIPQCSMKDYYVKLQIIIQEDEEKKHGNYESISGTKKEIEIEKLFDQPSGNTSAKTPAKLLVLGGAGVGKSTLLQYLAYRWSNDEIWKDKFDFVYRVTLKTLLSDDWKEDYEKKELRESKLKCLVHYNLIRNLAPKKMKKVGLDTIYWPEKKEKILLLLDGYDEVAHLKDNDEYQEVEDEIFEHQNVILTSRPNAVDNEMKAKFDLKIINTGLDDEGIEQYFTQYFKNDPNKGEELRKFLATNSLIKDICKIPVNIAMLCYIWSTSDSSDNLQEISRVSQLYSEVVSHLGYRYFAKKWKGSKAEGLKLKDKIQNGEFALDELQILAHAAYKGMTGGGIEVPVKERVESLIIKGACFKGGKKDVHDEQGISLQSSINYLAKRKHIKDDSTSKVTIGQVYKYGLLKPENTLTAGEAREEKDTELQEQQYSFIHLTFQEYLTAYFFKQRFHTGNEQERNEIFNYIAEHRNEPRYLMTFKFLAGLVTFSQGDADKMVEMFWEAMTCNVDGIIELGIETKVSLLMHLLSQAKIKGEIDPRIPNRDQMIHLIDAVVLNDILNWRTQLKESDYMSNNIKEGLIRTLDSEDNFKWHGDIVKEIEAESSQELKSALKSLVKEKTEKPNELEHDIKEVQAIEMVEDFVSRFSSEEQQKVFKKLIGIIKTYKTEKWQQIRQAIDTLRKLFLQASLTSEEQKELLDRLVELIGNSSLVGVASKLAIKMIGLSDNKGLAGQTVEKIVKNLESSPAALKDAVVEFIIPITPMVKDSKVIIQVVDKIVSLLDEEKYSEDLACNNLGRIAAAAKDDQVATHIFSSLNKFGQRFTKSVFKDYYCDNLAENIVSHGDQRLITQSFEHFATFLSSTDVRIIQSGAKCLGKLVPKIEDKTLIESVLNSAFKVLDSDEEEYGSAKSSITAAFRVFCLKDSTLVAKLIDRLLPYLDQQNMIGYRVASTFENLIGITKDKALAQKLIDKGIGLLGSDNNTTKKMGIEMLSGVSMAVKDKDLTAKAVEKIYNLLFDKDAYVRSSANIGVLNALNIQGSPELSATILEKFINVIVKDEDLEKKKAALANWTLVVDSSDKEKALARFYEVISGLLSQENKELRVAAFTTIDQLLSKLPTHTVPSGVLEKILASLNDQDHNVQETAFKVVSRLGIKNLDNVLSFVANEDKEIQKIAIETVKTIADRIRNKEPANVALEKIMEIFPSNEITVKKQALKAIPWLYRISEKKDVSPTVAQKVGDLLLEDDNEVRSAACAIAKEMIQFGESSIIGKMVDIVQNYENLSEDKKKNVLDLCKKAEWKPENKQVITEFLSKILNLLNFDEWEIRSLATQTFENAIMIFPNEDLAVKALDKIHDALKKLEKDYIQVDYTCGIVRSVKDRKKIIPILDELINTISKHSLSHWGLTILNMLNKEDSDLAIYLFKKVMQENKGNAKSEVKDVELRVAPYLARSFLLPFKGYMQNLLRHPNKELREASEKAVTDVFAMVITRMKKVEEIIKPSMKADIDVLNWHFFDEKMKVEVKNQLKPALLSYYQEPNTQNLDKIKHILLTELNQRGNRESYQLIEAALALIGYEEASSGDEHRKRVVDFARKMIALQIKYLNEEGLRWIGNNLTSLAALSKETKPFCKKLCHKMLEDFEITEAEKELMIHFVSQGLTISISRAGDVIFEGKRYTIKTKNSASVLEEIAKAVIDQNRDLLALQYKENKPIFPKKCSAGMKKAAADIEAVYSLVDRANKLSNDVWFFTKLESQGQEIVLMEQRSAIGDHLIYNVNQKQLIRVNPQDSNNEREKIFGKYSAGKKYQGSCSTLDFSQGNEVIQKEKLPDIKKATTNTYFQQELLGLGNSERIDFIQSELDKKLSDHQKVLEGKLKDAKLSPEEEEKVKEYYHAFVGTFASVYTSAQVLNSGQFQLDVGDNRVSLLSTLVSFAPFVGDTLSSMITSVSEFIQSREMIKNARKMKDIAVDAVSLSQMVGEVACKVVMDKNKQQEIFAIKEEDMQKISGSLLEKISKVYDLVGEKIDDLLYTKMYKTAAAKLGHNDANELVEQWVQDKVQLKTIQAQFVKIATKSESNKGVEPLRAEKVGVNDQKRSSCCTMF